MYSILAAVSSFNIYNLFKILFKFSVIFNLYVCIILQVNPKMLTFKCITDNRSQFVTENGSFGGAS